MEKREAVGMNALGVMDVLRCNEVDAVFVDCLKVAITCEIEICALNYVFDVFSLAC